VTQFQQSGGGWPKGQAGTQAPTQANPADVTIPVAQVTSEIGRAWKITLAAMDSFDGRHATLDQAGWQAVVTWGNPYANETALLDWPVGGATYCVVGSLVQLWARSRYAGLNPTVTIGSGAQSRGFIEPDAGGDRHDPATWTAGQFDLDGSVTTEQLVPVPRRARAYRVLGWLETDQTPPGQGFWPLEWASQQKRFLSFGQRMANGGQMTLDWLSGPNYTIAGAQQPISPYLEITKPPWFPLHPRTTDVALDFSNQGGANLMNAHLNVQYLLDMG
jgi:hypothetical protein